LKHFYNYANKRDLFETILRFWQTSYHVYFHTTLTASITSMYSIMHHHPHSSVKE
jgi:hypothetical protein